MHLTKQRVLEKSFFNSFQGEFPQNSNKKLLNQRTISDSQE